MIQFENISIKNFLSIGEDGVMISLNDSPMTLIEGTNGAGKTTVMEAICFALFGKSYRGINKGCLVNSINKKGAKVILRFTAYGIQWKIVRGIKPDVFEIVKNGEHIDKDANAREMQSMLELNILRFGYDAFCQVALLGSTNLVSFFRLSAKDRRGVIEKLLGIEVLGTMNVILKDRIKVIKDSVREFETKVQHAKASKEKQEQFYQYVLSQYEKAKTDVTNKKSELEEQLKSLNKRLDGLNLTEFRPEPDDSELLENFCEIDKVLAKYALKLKKHKDIIAYYEGKDSCQECGQVIQDGFRTEKIQESIKQVACCSESIDELNELKAEVQENLTVVRKDIEKYRNEKAQHQSEIRAIETEIRKVENELRNLDVDEVSDGDIIQQKNELLDIENSLNTYEEMLYYELKKLDEHKVCELILKDDGVKQNIMGEYLEMINALLEKYLREFGFKVFMRLDSNFEIEIQTPTHLSFTYESFSEGEKKRIDLALLLVFLEVSAVRNSVHTNVLFLDEVFDSSLDKVGAESLLRVFRDVVSKDKNIFVISHTLSDDLRGSFSRVIKVSKQGPFSSYKYV